MLMKIKFLFFLAGVLSGCATGRLPDDFIYSPVKTANYDIASWSRNRDSKSPVHIYIEGDGHAFDAYGRPTSNPTPHGDLVRRMASMDDGANVVYLARPCQYVMSDKCRTTDWTTGRFSENIVNAMSDAVGQVAKNRPVVLIGYSGGALISGLIIRQNPAIDVREWITVAGVLNHSDWTEYFGDSPLSDSIDLDVLPRVPQRHYIAQHDNVVPMSLSRRWLGDGHAIVIPNATHGDLKKFKLHIDKI